MSKSILAAKIGKTLFNIAKANNTLSIVDNDLKQCSKAILEENSFITLMNNPNISKEQKCQIIDKAFSGVNKYVVNVIKILANNLQITLIGDVVEVYTEISNVFNNTTFVKVESVYKLNSEELTKLADTIKGKLNVNKVEIDNVIDESLIGGLKISYKGKVIDSTIKTRIKDIQRKMANI
ncbi:MULTISPECIES: ATP synthase F1 subunit delta [unclassified Gemella]|uniref:ATP synthase F1 subunit delta n=1 Tax=unclassified Gemella TaxID=2624949 RepID=UPI001C0571DE|nr:MULTISPECIES: ATP synthase F1 subunit delta [unclassified Gemella]MBU0278422.1 ATP synthase F1 subunit delta [Gemella sp. zg-1178]QWQ38966.1 ATP synthase F1 subunit delta [Gemella sp. zg-570]